MDMSGHAILKIVKGIQKVPGDSLSAEQGLDEIDLLDPTGFACDKYDMKIPALKSSAVYADSPLTDGRTLISGVLGNVIETIRTQLTAGSIIQLAAMLTKLGRFKQDCNDYWDTNNQIEPVYIKHQVIGEPGPRYALLYDIDIDVDTPLIPSEPNRTVTLVIEREYGWRGIAPGDNPKKWTYHIQNRDFNSNGAALTSGIDHLVNATSQNRREWSGSGLSPTILATKNYFDIPASLIPGDLDALCCLSVGLSSARQGFYFARTSKPDLSVSGDVREPAYILNAGDAPQIGSDVSTAADIGAPISTTTGTQRRGVVSFATVTTDAVRFTWGGDNRAQFDFTTMRGRFAAFVRARLSAASTVTMHLQAMAGNGISVVYPTQTLTDVGTGGVGDTGLWSFVYMGVVSFPLSDERILVGDNGLGPEISVAANYTIALYAARPGAAVSLYVADLIFIPIDEIAGSVDIGTTATTIVIDNTGYFMHGKPDPSVHGGMIVESAQITANSLTLKPGCRNRIHLLDTQGTAPTRSQISNTFTSQLNIVPRWSGLRDV